jgi:hypothetical protein
MAECQMAGLAVYFFNVYAKQWLRGDVLSNTNLLGLKGWKLF